VYFTPGVSVTAPSFECMLLWVPLPYRPWLAQHLWLFFQAVRLKCWQQLGRLWARQLQPAHRAQRISKWSVCSVICERIQYCRRSIRSSKLNNKFCESHTGTAASMCMRPYVSTYMSSFHRNNSSVMAAKEYVSNCQRLGKIVSGEEPMLYEPYEPLRKKHVCRSIFYFFAHIRLIATHEDF
jgi:hypothetical protein